jgi:hypothetical protein
LGANFVKGSYFGAASSQTGTLQVDITPYEKRAATSPQLVKQLQNKFDSDFTAAKVVVGQVDLGPPFAPPLPLTLSLRTATKPLL